MCAGRVELEAELNDADARPAKATRSAKIRTAVFIFGNLSMQNHEGKYPLIGLKY
jgi:hypothetical protein